MGKLVDMMQQLQAILIAFCILSSAHQAVSQGLELALLLGITGFRASGSHSNLPCRHDSDACQVSDASGNRNSDTNRDSDINRDADTNPDTRAGHNECCIPSASAHCCRHAATSCPQSTAPDEQPTTASAEPPTSAALATTARRRQPEDRGALSCQHVRQQPAAIQFQHGQQVPDRDGAGARYDSLLINGFCH